MHTQVFASHHYDYVEIGLLKNNRHTLQQNPIPATFKIFAIAVTCRKVKVFNPQIKVLFLCIPFSGTD